MKILHAISSTNTKGGGVIESICQFRKLCVVSAEYITFQINQSI